MENASKFLIMAASVFLGLLLISSFVYVFRAGAKVSKEYEEARIQQQLIAENAKFEYFNKPNNTASEIVSLINLIYDYNESVDFSENDSITLEIFDKDNTNYYINKNNKFGIDLGRNYISTGSDKVSVYEFVKKNSDSKLDKDGKTIYEYYFDAAEFTYSLDTSRVTKMVFRARASSNTEATT